MFFPHKIRAIGRNLAIANESQLVNVMLGDINCLVVPLDSPTIDLRNNNEIRIETFRPKFMVYASPDTIDILRNAPNQGLIAFVNIEGSFNPFVRDVPANSLNIREMPRLSRILPLPAILAFELEIEFSALIGEDSE